jgi:hypothetical protein
MPMDVRSFYLQRLVDEFTQKTTWSEIISNPTRQSSTLDRKNSVIEGLYFPALNSCLWKHKPDEGDTSD